MHMSELCIFLLACYVSVWAACAQASIYWTAVRKMRIFITVTGNTEVIALFPTVFWWDDILYVFDLCSFCLSFNTWAFKLWCLTECIGFEFWGLQWVLWWSIALVWCFSIDYGNASRWIEQGGDQESCGITGICRPIKIHKPAHLTSEWWRFINMIYFAMHICYPACFSHVCVCFVNLWHSGSCSNWPLVMRVISLWLSSDSLLIKCHRVAEERERLWNAISAFSAFFKAWSTPRLRFSASGCPLFDLWLETVQHFLSNVQMI